MKVINQEIPFLITDVKNHLEIKDKVIQDINNMGTFSFIDDKQSIKSSDWHLSPEFKRPYINHLIEIFNNVVLDVEKFFGFTEKLMISNYWYQKYQKGDYHEWHSHFKTSFSNIYYLSLPDGCAKTSFKLQDKEFFVDVKEGQILTFPAFYLHCSKPNQSDKEKIVVVFNS